MTHKVKHMQTGLLLIRACSFPMEKIQLKEKPTLEVQATLAKPL